MIRLQMTDPTRRNENERRERRRLTHVSRGGRPRMVDVSRPSRPPPAAPRPRPSSRWSRRRSALIIDGQTTKGDVLTVAEMAGVMAAKNTSELIPLCHPIPLTDLVVEITPERNCGGVRIRATAATVAGTGVEMEAMTAAAVAALTVYDMVKGVDRSAEIRDCGCSRRAAASPGSGTGRRADGSPTARAPSAKPRARARAARHARPSADERAARSC